LDPQLFPRVTMLAQHRSPLRPLVPRHTMSRNPCTFTPPPRPLVLLQHLSLLFKLPSNLSASSSPRHTPVMAGPSHRPLLKARTLMVPLCSPSSSIHTPLQVPECSHWSQATVSLSSTLMSTQCSTLVPTVLSTLPWLLLV